jgi:protein arginine kinase
MPGIAFAPRNDGMDIEQLALGPGAWLQATGPENDIVISTRLRLARNLADFPFTTRASESEKREIESRLAGIVTRLPEGNARLHYFPVSRLTVLDRQLLVERQLISRELASGEGPRGVAIAEDEAVSVMINEEDHLRIQVIRSGYTLDDCWNSIDRLDDAVEDKARLAFSDEFGYLTACPTNVGTGMRASVMLHLPALTMTKQIEKVFRALQKIQLTVRGLYGEGSQASGDFYQISNSVTLGRAEGEILSNLGAVVPRIIEYERKARDELVSESRQTLHDRVSRAFGILRTAQTISSEETMQLLSSIRMGVNLELIRDIPIATINDLFIRSQPAHLQKQEHAELPTEDRNVARASFLRDRLRNVRQSEN